jgi:hypothetical protein
MSDKNCLTHHLEADNSNSKDKPTKDEVKNNYYNVFKYISSQIKSIKIKFISNQITKYLHQILIIKK